MCPICWRDEGTATMTVRLSELHRGKTNGGEREKERREYQEKSSRDALEKTIPSNQISFICSCGFYPVICHVRLKSRFSPNLFKIRGFLLLLIEAFPQKCNTCLDGINHPFILLNLHHVFSVLPFLLPHM